MRALRTAALLSALALLGALITLAPVGRAGPSAVGAIAPEGRSPERATDGVVRPSRLTGEPVEGGGADRPAALGIGDWLQRAGIRTGTLHYAIEKTDPATTLRVSVVGRATSADLLTGRLTLGLDGPDGGECDSALGSGNARTPEVLGASVDAGPGLDCDGRSGTYVLTVDLRVVDRTPLGIRVSEEPGVDDVGFRDVTAPRVGDPTGPGRARVVAGGTSYDDATRIGEGRWSSDIDPGEILLYRLPLDFGQSADVRVTFDPEGLDEVEQSSRYIGLVLSDPMRSPLVRAAGGESLETIDDPLASAIPPVSRARRITGDVTGVADWTTAGDYYVAVSLAGDELSDPRTPTQPFTIDVAVGGEPADPPTYAGGVTWSVADGVSDAGVTDVTEPSESSPGAAGAVGAGASGAGAHLPLGPPVATGVGVAVALLTGVLVLRRRRRP